MAQSICSVEGCERSVDVKSRGWCFAHYNRWRVHGDPGGAEIRRRVKPNGPCNADGCERPVHARGLCSTHYARWLARGNAGSGEIKPYSKGPEITYTAVHTRVRQARGRPDQFTCVGCGRPAQEWAYNHADPHEITAPDGADHSGMVYSLDVVAYQPMCKPCHRAFDKAHAKG